jgi:hypothetical protein
MSLAVAIFKGNIQKTARRISDEEIKLSIIIDANPAQKAILDLEKKTINYKWELTALEKLQKALQRQRKTDTDEYRTNAADAIKNRQKALLIDIKHV